MYTWVLTPIYVELVLGDNISVYEYKGAGTLNAANWCKLIPQSD